MSTKLTKPGAEATMLMLTRCPSHVECSLCSKSLDLPLYFARSGVLTVLTTAGVERQGYASAV